MDRDLWRLSVYFQLEISATYKLTFKYLPTEIDNEIKMQIVFIIDDN